ncbi:DUF72 domain-containing protein [Chitinophaga sp.]|uniref:DUF72 domain-containing protein n=1 Tax=Chitinophaga sp. TaxID=1869181 RepID=UPI0025BFEB79|nr:DUF72 domain-containing protein [Chitinophaga sp.]
MAGKIHIGTSGWSYKHWRLRFYPIELTPTDYLGYYRQFFSTTEINTSFYHLPRPQTVAHWVETAKKGFHFCPKISRYITHIKKLNDPEESLPKFFDVFDPFHKKLGPVLIQLPPSLSFDEEKAKHFFTVLKQYKGYHYALEARHKSWFEDVPLALLRKHKIAFVIAEAGKRWPTASAVTHKHIYIRFHGEEGFDSSYSDKTLKAYAKKILHWQETGHNIWAFFNNDGNANAINNALRLMELTSA